jgi:hypothetical protein
MRGRHLDCDLDRDLARHVDCDLGHHLDAILMAIWIAIWIAMWVATWIAIGVSRAPEEWSGPRPAAPTASDTRLPRAHLRFDHARPDVRRAAALPRQG